MIFSKGKKRHFPLNIIRSGMQLKLFLIKEGTFVLKKNSMWHETMIFLLFEEGTLFLKYNSWWHATMIFLFFKEGTIVL